MHGRSVYPSYGSCGRRDDTGISARTAREHPGASMEAPRCIRVVMTLGGTKKPWNIWVTWYVGFLRALQPWSWLREIQQSDLLPMPKDGHHLQPSSADGRSPHVSARPPSFDSVLACFRSPRRHRRTFTMDTPLTDPNRC